EVRDRGQGLRNIDEPFLCERAVAVRARYGQSDVIEAGGIKGMIQPAPAPCCPVTKVPEEFVITPGIWNHLPELYLKGRIALHWVCIEVCFRCRGIDLDVPLFRDGVCLTGPADGKAHRVVPRGGVDDNRVFLGREFVA